MSSHITKQPHSPVEIYIPIYLSSAPPSCESLYYVERRKVRRIGRKRDK